MGSRQFGGVCMFLDQEMQRFDAINGNPVCPCHKEHKSFLLLEIEGMQQLPEVSELSQFVPHYKRLLSIAPLVLGTLLQLLNIDLFDAPDKHPQLLRFEGIDDPSCNHPLEASAKGQVLLGD